MKKKISCLCLLALAALGFASCDENKTYAEQRDDEIAAIKDYIAKNHINVIELSDFQRDTLTDVSKNEYVLFNATGVYMQIERRGIGPMLQPGESATLLCRFTETSLFNDTLKLSNNVNYYAAKVDKISVQNTSGTFSGSFDATSSVMYDTYGTYSGTAVPAAWLVPLSYIRIGRPDKETDEIAKVRLIVPHTEGHGYASQQVIPYAYEITYQRGR